MAQAAVKGIVDSSYTKQVKTRYGDKNIHHIVVDGVDVSTGFKQEHQEGELVNIAVDFKYGNWQKVPGDPNGLPAATAKPNGGGGAPQGQQPSRTGGGVKSFSRGSFPIDPKDGQMSIIRQSSVSRAIEMVDTLMEAGVFTFDNPDDYMKEVFRTALFVTDFCSGQDIVNLKKAKEAALEQLA